MDKSGDMNASESEGDLSGYDSSDADDKVQTLSCPQAKAKLTSSLHIVTTRDGKALKFKVQSCLLCRQTSKDSASVVVW